MPSKPRTQQQRRDATSSAILDNASNLFGARGYQVTSLEDIATVSGTTIRPIYHYYGNKKNLFQAVTERLEAQLADALQQVQADGVSLADYWETFMQFGRDHSFRQIVLVDSPVVLGRERWAHSPVVRLAIDILVSLFPQLQPETRMLIAQMAVAALTEAAMSLSEPGHTGKEKAFEEVSAIIRAGLMGVRV